MATPINPIIPTDAFSAVSAKSATYLQTPNGYTLIEDNHGNLSLFKGATYLGTVANLAPFTTYTLITDVTLDATDETNDVLVTSVSVDEVDGWVYFFENGTGNARLGTCKLDGSSFSALIPSGSPYALGVGPLPYQSGNGTLQVWSDGTDIYVTSAGAIVKTIALSDITQPNIGFAISTSGQYVAIVGPNGTDAKKAQLQVWQGS